MGLIQFFNTLKRFTPEVEPEPEEGVNSFADLLAMSPVEKYTSNPILVHDATYTNLAPGGIIEDPLDPDVLLHYIGEFQGNTRVNSRVALYTSPKNDPYNLTRVGVVIQKGVDNTFSDLHGASFGSVLYIGGIVYYYYGGVRTNTGGANSERVCLATSTDGGRTFTKQGEVVAGDQVNEFNLTDPTVRKFGDTWYMYVTAKTTTPLPTLGIRLWTSTDGTSWTRTGTQIVAIGAARGYDSLYIEGCDVQKIGDDYVCVYTTSSQSNVWSSGIARASSPSVAFTKELVTWLQHSASGDDGGSVAVTLLHEIDDEWHIFYQGTTQFQPATVWDIFAARLTETPDTFPPGFLTGRGGWTGDAFFDTQNVVSVGTGNSVRALGNTGFTTVFVEHAVDVTPSATSSYKVKIRASVTNGATFVGGFYVMEGSTQICGIYIGNSSGGKIKHLRNTGWINVQAAVNNTTYEIELVLVNNSTFNVHINGASVLSNVPYLNNIVTKANKIRLEKSDATTALVYFGDIIMKNSGVETTVDIGN